MYVFKGSEMIIDFSEYGDVSNAFVVLFITCLKSVATASSEEFKNIRNSCVAQARGPLRSLIKHSTDAYSLFEVLGENTQHFNWMNVSFLKVIAIAHGNKHLQSLIENYTDVIYSKSLYEVWDGTPYYYSVRDKYYSELKAAFGDKDPDNMTVKELMKSRPQLAKEIAVLTAVISCD